MHAQFKIRILKDFVLVLCANNSIIIVPRDGTSRVTTVGVRDDAHGALLAVISLDDHDE